MSLHKYIYLRYDCPKKSGKVFANIHVLVGRSQGTIKDFQDMAQIMRNDFKSISMNNFTIATWQTHVDPSNLPEGWFDVKHGRTEYCW